MKKAKNISLSKIAEKVGVIPHENQLRILRGLKRYTCITAGSPFWENTSCVITSGWNVTCEQKTIWIVAPTYDLAKRTWKYIYGWALREFPALKINLSNLSIENPENQSILEL